MNGIIPVMSASSLEDKNRRESAVQQARPLIKGLASHVRKRWDVMRDHKRSEIEPRLLECSRARSMEYSPTKLAQIRSQGGSEIYMGIVSAKCRTATAWLRDALLGTGTDKPWGLSPTPIPEIAPSVIADLQKMLARQLQAEYEAGAEPLPEMMVKQLAAQMQDTAKRAMQHKSEEAVDRMEKKMEDQLHEGGFTKAMFEFTNDVATFPFAVMKGPIPRKRKLLKWAGQEDRLALTETVRDEWDRVDPYKFYWAPWGSDVQNMPCIEVHNLTRDDLQEMIGVEGYDETAIRAILADFGAGGASWLENDQDEAQDVAGLDFDDAGGDVIDAIQLWDSIPGRMLRDWGLPQKDIEDLDLSYPCEVWMVNNTVIKAVLNYDPLGRKPYFVTSFEKVPGRIDGNGVADLTLDAQSMCNAAARSLANNMGIASGPQVGVNVSRLPNGEDITNIYPWKIWQFRQSDYGDTSPPMQFFQPESNAQELMAVFGRFMEIADEVSGIPRYMTGQHVPGAGRTSSGLSMLISNAGKSIKQVIANIDHDVIEPLLQRQYQRNLRYSDDPDMIGDVGVVARGAMALVVKEAEAVRKTEFLRLILESPVAQSIVGLPGTSELMRDLAGNLNMNVDRLVPSRELMEKKVQEEAAKQQAMQEQQMALQQQEQGIEQQRLDMDTQIKQISMATQAKKLQEDGTPQGGRQDNYVSPRPNGQ